jgi:periplasmic protein TonB
MRRFAFLSLGLHLAVLAGLFAWSQYARPTGEAPDVQGAVELVLLEQQGTRATAPPPPPAPAPEIVTPALSEAQAQPLPPPPPAPTEAAEEAEPLPLPPPPPPPVPQKEQPAPAKQHASTSPVQRAVEAPEINLNGNNSETNALVSGDHVVPAGVDARFHNKEPVYPLEAVRRAQQGMVTLLIHVSPEGLAAGVDVVQGSGYVLLDRAARDAVVAWRFLPAVKDGQPIPFDMKLRVVFHLD